VFLRAAIAEAPGAARHRGPGHRAGPRLAAAEAEDADFAAQVREDRQHLDAIRATREASAAEYFARHAADWDQLRSLHIADGPVEAALVALLDRPIRRGWASCSTWAPARAAWRTARPACQPCHRAGQEPGNAAPGAHPPAGLPAGQVDLVQGDFLALPFADGAFDTVLFHQVLHYALAPEAVLAEAARVTAPGGASPWSILPRTIARNCAWPMPMRAWAFPMRRWPSCWAMPGSSRWPSRRWPDVN
jgi:ArsR family transcriptional regulator